MKIHQIIMNGILNSDLNTLPGKFKGKLLLTIRDRLYKNKDILIEYNLDGRKILLPVWHDLPTNIKIFPLYSKNIGRIAAYLKQKYNNMKVIDIGANVGDSVFIIKAQAYVPILCIEGNDYFYSILKRNTEQWDDVFIENAFIGDISESKGSYIYSKGSGRIIEAESSSGSIRFESLETIAHKNPQFEYAKLIKIDTDGFDCRIIRNSLNYFERSKPVLFFEYDPYLLHQLNDDGLSVFDSLLDIGYKTAIFYDNNGDYLLTSSLAQKSIIEDIHYYYSGRNIEHYTDICVFHKEDNDAADEIRETEIKFYAKNRNYKI